MDIESRGNMQINAAAIIPFCREFYLCSTMRASVCSESLNMREGEKREDTAASLCPKSSVRFVA